MKFRDDINKIMDSVDIRVDNEMKNNILNHTTRRSERKRSFMGTRRAVAIAMAAVLCIGTVMVTADDITDVWNDLIAKVANVEIEVDNQQKIKLMKNGYVDSINEENVFDSSDGITVSLVQTVADKKGIYVYLNIKSKDIKLKKNSFFNYVRVNVEGVGSIERIIDDITPLSDYEGVMAIYGSIDTSKYESLDIEGKNIEVVLGDLQYIDVKSGEVKYEEFNDSEWSFSWIGKGCDDSKVLQLSDSVQIDNMEVNLHSLEITPLSVLMEFECSSDEQDDWLYIPFTVVMKNGVEYKYGENENDMIFADDYQTVYGADYGAVYGVDEKLNDKTFIRIKNPIDINEIDYIEVCGTRYDVE